MKKHWPFFPVVLFTFLFYPVYAQKPTAFIVSAHNGPAKSQWQTTMDGNSRQFVIEKSADGDDLFSLSGKLTCHTAASESVAVQQKYVGNESYTLPDTNRGDKTSSGKKTALSSNKMKNRPKATVEKMFAAFGNGDIEKLLETVSDSTVWIYYGTPDIPFGKFEGKEGVTVFVKDILTNTEVLSFEPQQFITEGDMVVVIGREHQRDKATGKDLRQRWVQIYTVKNNLITRMEEFPTPEL